MKLLTALSVLPVVALGSTLATDYTADRSLRVERRIHTTSEVVDMVMIVDGQEMEGRGFGGGASERTLARLFERETGMSFRAWRQQLRLLRALELLAAGTPVTRVALDLGYESTSAFSAMFRRVLGTAPTRYFGRWR